MEITTKFNLHDKVFFITDNRIVEGIIQNINVHISYSVFDKCAYTRTFYKVSYFEDEEMVVDKFQNDLFADINQLTTHLLNNSLSLNPEFAKQVLNK